MVRNLYKVFKRLGGMGNYLFLLILRCPVDTVLCIINACFLNNVFDALEQGTLEKLYTTCLQFVVANFLLFSYNGIMWGKFAVFSAHLYGRLKESVFLTMLKLPLEKLESKSDGAWLTRANSDAKMTMNLVNGALNIPHFVFAVVRIVTASVILGSISPLLLFVELAVLIPHACLRQKLVVQPLERWNRLSQEHIEEATVSMTAMIECGDTIRLYEAQKFLLNHYEEKSLQVVKYRLQMNLRKACGEFMHLLLSRGGYLLLFFLGCKLLVMRGIEFSTYEGTGIAFVDNLMGEGMAFGTLTAALQYRGAMVMGTMMLLNSLVEIKKNSIGLKRMEEIYESDQ